MNMNKDFTQEELSALIESDLQDYGEVWLHWLNEEEFVRAWKVLLKSARQWHYSYSKYGLSLAEQPFMGSKEVQGECPDFILDITKSSPAFQVGYEW